MHNGESFLYEALESVAWQTLEPAEVIVVDDGSTDCSATIAHEFPGVRCLRQENEGVSAARNAGIADAAGDVVAFLDSDDVWLPDKLASQCELLPAPMVIALQRTMLDGLTTAPAWYREESIGERVVCSEPSSWLVPVATLEAVGPFDPAYRRGEDWEWLNRARRMGFESVLCDEVLLLRRLHKTNLSHNTADSRASVMRLLRRSAALNSSATREVAGDTLNG